MIGDTGMMTSEDGALRIRSLILLFVFLPLKFSYPIPCRFVICEIIRSCASLSNSPQKNKQ